MMGMVRLSLLYTLHICVSLDTANELSTRCVTPIDVTDIQIWHTQMAYAVMALAKLSQGPFVGALYDNCGAR